MKKLLWVLGIVSLSFVSSPVRAADEGWTITNFVDSITILSTGKVHVQETIDVDFGSLVKHGIYRDLPYRYQVDGSKISTDVEELTVTDGSKAIPYTVTSNDANFELKIGDANKTISGKHTYVISYLETGILRAFDSYDELYWNVTGNSWPVPVESASTTVILPDGASVVQSSCYQGTTGSTDQCTATGSKFATSRTLASGEGFTVALGYTKGAVPILAGTGKIPGQMTDTTFWQGVLFFAITLLAGIAFLIYKWWKGGRDDDTVPNYQRTIIAEYEPPADLRPGEVGVLMDERADAIDLSASIVDLAVRGYLTITEVPKTWVLGSRDYKLDRTDKATTDLMDWEQKLLTAIFSTGSSVQISKLRSTKLATDLQAVKSSLYTDVTNKGLFPKNPDDIRNSYIVVGFILGFGASFLSAFGISSLLGAFSGVTAALGVLGFITVGFAFVMPKRSAKGKELLRKALGYKLFLITTDRDRIPYFEKEGMFMKALPYAMVFGVTSQLAKVMKDLGINPVQPGWYIGSHPFVAVAFVSDMNNFSSSLSSAFTPVSSSSGSGGSGFSGGGFGGGGGGSW